MTRGTRITVVALAAVAAAAGFYAARQWLEPPRPASTPAPASPRQEPAVPVPRGPANLPTPARRGFTDAVIGKRRPDFALPDVGGKVHRAAEWDGQVLVINFWATWCPPCVREMPALNELYLAHKDKGFAVIGIALDAADDVEQFIDPMGIDYPVLVAEEEGLELARAYGNRLGVLPYTVVVDRDGRIRAVHPGEIHREQAEEYLKDLL